METENQLPETEVEDQLIADEMELDIHYNGIVGGKPQYEIEVKTILNFVSKFRDKLLCDGWTFSLGLCMPLQMPLLLRGIDRPEAPAGCGTDGVALGAGLGIRRCLRHQT